MLKKENIMFFSFTAPQSSCGYIPTSDVKGFLDTASVRDQLRVYL